MKKLFFILTFLFFFCFDALATTCADISVNPNITVTYSFGKLSFDTSKDVKTISNIAKEFNLFENGASTRGLSTADIKFDISIQTVAHPIGINQFCVVPSDITVFLGIEKPIIYLANTLEKDSCEYNIVLRHEKTHQQINKKTLEYYLPIFKASVVNIIKNIPAVSINNTSKIEETTRLLTEKYNKKINFLVEFIKKEIAQEQVKLDHIDNYRYENQLCQEKN